MEDVWRFNEQEVLSKLREAGATATPCHRCGKKRYTILDRMAPVNVQDAVVKPGVITIGGPNSGQIPAAVVICESCGAMTMHALGALGLLPPADDEEKKNG